MSFFNESKINRQITVHKKDKKYFLHIRPHYTITLYIYASYKLIKNSWLHNSTCPYTVVERKLYNHALQYHPDEKGLSLVPLKVSSSYHLRERKRKSSWNTYAFTFSGNICESKTIHGVKASPSRAYFRARNFVYFMIWMRLKTNCFIFFITARPASWDIIYLIRNCSLSCFQSWRMPESASILHSSIFPILIKKSTWKYNAQSLWSILCVVFWLTIYFYHLCHASRFGCHGAESGKW